MFAAKPLGPALEKGKIGGNRTLNIFDPVNGRQRAGGGFGFDKNRRQGFEDRCFVRSNLRRKQQKHQSAFRLSGPAIEITEPMKKFDTVPALLSHWPIA
jgi:hypothetical protein